MLRMRALLFFSPLSEIHATVVVQVIFFLCRRLPICACVSVARYSAYYGESQLWPRRD